jgi:peptidoglycan hydrolase-like protein with peptidoglycan-binding domain
VRRIQAALHGHGMYAGPLDGRRDNKTLEAIRRYQVSVGDRPTGELTRLEIVKLLNE